MDSMWATVNHHLLAGTNYQHFWNLQSMESIQATWSCSQLLCCIKHSLQLFSSLIIATKALYKLRWLTMNLLLYLIIQYTFVSNLIFIKMKLSKGCLFNSEPTRQKENLLWLLIISQWVKYTDADSRYLMLIICAR